MNILLIFALLSQQPQSPKEQPKKDEQKGDDNKKQGGKHFYEPTSSEPLDRPERSGATRHLIRVSSEGICLCLVPSQDSRRERSSNFQAFVKMALETLLGSCRRKHGGPRGKQG